jgi:hypothetical protein
VLFFLLFVNVHKLALFAPRPFRFEDLQQQDHKWNIISKDYYKSLHGRQIGYTGKQNFLRVQLVPAVTVHATCPFSDSAVL